MEVFKKRDSNVELLRIVSMLLVLVAHASYVSLNPPTQADISNSFGLSLLRSFSESFSEVCVNVFILISGWYGIKAKLKRFTELIFQVLFFSISIYVFMRVFCLIGAMPKKGWIELFTFRYGAYWFVRAYIVFYLFTPLLNSFVDKSSRKQLFCYIICFYVIQMIYGFYNSVSWFSAGYSPISFMGLYLIARFMRLYPSKYTCLKRKYYIEMYLVMSFVIALVSISLTLFFNKGGTILLVYSSPFVIFSSICLFLYFVKLSFYSDYVNWISISCFSVYLVHCSPFIFYPYYIDIIRDWYDTEAGICFILYTALLIIFFFCLSVLFDKIRIFIWNIIISLIEKKNYGFTDKVK